MQDADCALCPDGPTCIKGYCGTNPVVVP
jgi:hypothetical protein